LEKSSASLSSQVEPFWLDFVSSRGTSVIETLLVDANPLGVGGCSQVNAASQSSQWGDYALLRNLRIFRPGFD
jgi:hypothetical protein